MEINKRCISAFAKTGPFVALATKSKLFDTAFSLTSELILVNYMTGHVFPAIATDHKFCKILWCEFPDGSSSGEMRRMLVAGHENGVISVYEHKEDGLVLLKSKECLQDDIVTLDFLVSKAVLVAASSKGRLSSGPLTNLDKEFSLEVALPQNISAISCNPKVFKILCVGTTDGIIKVVDIKKLSVILTLNCKEFSEVRQLEWDPENNTKLKVMSEKGFITVFDLSNDSTCRIGSHENPLIGFQGSTIVSKTKLETNGVFIEIPESFECSISPRDPVVALSQSSGVTRIMSIPMYKKRVPFYRSTCHILTPTTVYRILVRNDREADSIDSFYEQLIAHVNSSEGSEILGNFLLDNHATYHSSEEIENGIDVNLTDTLEYEFVKNYFESLKTCDHPISLSTLDIIRSKDLSMLAQLTDFKVILVLCKLLNDYSALSRLKNPRILAAILIFHNCKDFTPLESTMEGQAIRSILEKNYSRYLDLFTGISKSTNYLVAAKEYERLISSIQPYLTQRMESRKLSEYFWYQVFMGNFEQVQNLNIVDPEIQFYIQMQNEKAYDAQSKAISDKKMGKSLNDRMSHLTVDDSKTRSNKSIDLPSRHSADIGPKLSHPIRPEMNASFPTRGADSATVPSFNQRSTEYSQSQTSIPKFPSKPIGSSPFNMIPTGSSHQGIPTTPQPSTSFGSSSQYGIPTAPQPSTQYGKPTAPQSGLGQFSAPVGSIQFPSKSIPSSPFSTSSAPIPSMPSSNIMKAPVQNFTPPPKSPFMGSLPTNPLKMQKPVSPTPLEKVPSPVMTVQNPIKNNEFAKVENPHSVISQFERLTGEIRQKAAQNTSIILKPRKTQFLNALSGFDSLDKNSISESVLYAMDLVVKRIQANGSNMKQDLSVLVEGYSDIVWLKAFVELVKMVY